ncbi:MULTISPECIES: hypothetical protein [unclassified Bradyrhizobium]|uniref:hypothetical protein n=1 Tax=unclassified Bradyrhizobium TaxID=2631580 RepID=UPI001CD47E4E|nr:MULTISPECIES: hypothetical protein [unclassified Bradyrhizobium]MCA1373948.1 hypothetical protein [Bradyrhizobium sp. IC4060]MCA1488119.1 hypothetical protein [Bradyrhizobium sp. IC4061]
MTSVPPPGAKPTTTSIGLSSGHAAHADPQAAKPKAVASARIFLFMISSPVFVIGRSRLRRAISLGLI